MIRTLKWVYKLGYDKAKNEILTILERERDFHMSQAQIKSAQEYIEKDHPSYDKERKVKPEHHEQRQRGIDDALERIDPVKYPSIEKYLEILK